MQEYWLAKLIGSVDKVGSRKKLQKAIYLLQFCKGFPLKCDYFLHYYGPYSWDLANLMEQLKTADIVREEPCAGYSGGYSYESSLKERGKEVLATFEATDTGKKALRRIQAFLEKFRALLEHSTWELELAATTAYFYEGNWQEARRQTRTFKKVQNESSALNKAVRLAKGFRGNTST